MPDQNQELLLKVINNSNGVPVTLTRIFSKEFEKNGTNELVDFMNEKFPVTLDNNTASSFNDLHLKYKKHQENAYISRQILVGNSELIKGVIGVASAPAVATGVGAIAVSGVNLFMDKLLDHAIDEFDKSVKESSSRIVGVHLREVREQTGKTLEEISGMSTTEAHNLLFDSNVGIMDNSIEFLTPEDRTKAVHEMTKILEDKLVNASALNKLVNMAQDADINSIKQEIKFISKVQENHQQCIKNINENLESLETNMSLLSNSVDVLQSEVRTNSENVGILKDYIFSNADVDGKIRLLDSGLLNNDLTESKRDALEKQLKALKAKQDLQKDIKNYLNKAQHITTILSNVGFDSEIVQKANDLINIGNTAMSAFTAYSSGDVIGSIATVSGLFGGRGKSDPAAKRHKQIMDKLNVLEDKIDEVLERQIIMMKNQQKILDTLAKISNQIDELHGLEMEKLEEIKTETLYNRLSNLRLLTRDLDVLETFSKPFKKFKLAKQRSYYEIRQFFADNGPRFEKREHILEDILSIHSNNLHELLLLKSYEVLGVEDGESINRITNLIEGYDKVIEYIDNYVDSQNLIDQNCYISMNDIYCLDDKFDVISNINSQDDYSNYWGLIKSSIIFTKQLERIYDVLEEVHIFYLLQKTTDSESELLSKEEFFSTQFHKRYGLRHFKDLLILVNIAIIQQNLLAGDILLKRFYDRLFRDDIENSENENEHEEYLQIIEVLNANRLLKVNFAKYFIKKQLDTKRKILFQGNEEEVKFDFFEYSLYLSDTSGYAQDERNKTNLRMCFDDHLQSKIIFHQGQWKLDLHRDNKDAYLEFPNSKTFNQGEVRYRRELFELIKLKTKIIDKISEYELTNFIEPNKSIYQHLKFN